MSDYYQQQVTMYMMRRRQRRLAEASGQGAAAPAAHKPRAGQWLTRLASLFSRRRAPRYAAPDMRRETAGPAG